MNAAELKYDVVICGGGFAGVYCAQSLAKQLGKGSHERVAIIADHNYMVFQPMLAEVCGSSLSPRHIVNPIRRLCRGASVLRGAISAIDLPGRSVTLDAGHFTGEVRVRFDHLALGLGSVVDLSRVPGMPEHAFLMKSVGDAQELRATIIDRLEEANLQADQESARKLLTFVIVGGGYSGVETAGQILDLIDGIGKFYPRLVKPEFKVILVHSGAHLLPEISQQLGLYCEKNITARGIEVVLNARVTSMTAGKVTLGNGRVIETHTVVSTVGNAPNPLVLDLCQKNNLSCQRGRLMTDATMRVPGQPALWAAGDCACVPLWDAKAHQATLGDKTSKGDEPKFCPPTAQFAYREGILLGKNIAAALNGGELRPFKFTGLGELASIGHRSAVADIFGFKFSGFIAWFMWRSIYLAKLPGLERKLRVMIDWTLDLFFPRDITLLRSRTTNLLREVHLEKGDTVFHSGEPALSFYIVKSGRIDLLDDNGVVKSLTAGEHFGERALLQDKIWRFNAIAAEPSTLVSLDAKIFETINRASTSIHKLFEHSANQYLTRQQIEALIATVPERVRQLLVRDVMSKMPVTLRPTQTVAEALTTVIAHPYNSFPLVAEDGRALGVISQTQIYDAMKEGLVTPESTLEKIQPVTLPTVLPDARVPEAMGRILRSGRNKLLVLDENARLCGVLTPVDLLAERERMQPGEKSF